MLCEKVATRASFINSASNTRVNAVSVSRDAYATHSFMAPDSLFGAEDERNFVSTFPHSTRCYFVRCFLKDSFSEDPLNKARSWASWLVILKWKKQCKRRMTGICCVCRRGGGRWPCWKLLKTVAKGWKLDTRKKKWDIPLPETFLSTELVIFYKSLRQFSTWSTEDK